MIVLKELRLHNFMVFRDEVINFEGRDIVGILGSYSEGNGRSNMSGKSTISESIKYLLVGTSRYKKEINLIHYNQLEMWVEAVFTEETSGAEYKLRRGRDHKNVGVLEIDWITGSRDAQEEINRLFGVSKSDFELTNYFQQSDIHGFMKLSPTEKTRFMMGWLDNEHWRDKEEAVKSDIAKLKSRVKELETTIKVLSDQCPLDITDLENERDIVFMDKKKLESGIKLNQTKVDLLEIERSELFESLSIKKASRSTILDKINELNSDKVLIQNSKNYAIKFKEELVIKKDSIKVVKRDKSKLTSLGMYNAQIIKDKLETLNKFKDNVGGVCPVINETCDRIACSEEQLAGLRNDISNLREVNSNVKKDLATISNNVLFEDRIVELKKLIEKHALVIEEANNDAKKVDQLRSQLADIETQISACAVNDLRVTIRDVKSIIEEIRENVHDKQTRLARISASIDNKVKLDAEIENHNNKLIEYKTTLSRKLFCSTMFGKRGIPSLEIENAFSSIEQDINDNFKYIGSKARVSFNPVTELNKKSVNCSCGFVYPKGFRGDSCPDCDKSRGKEIKEEISLDIHEEGIDSSFEGSSGGGQAIISFAVRVALTMIKRNQGKCNLNMLFLDEVDSALDAYFSQSIISSVMTLLRDKLGFKQIFIISHNHSIKEILPNTLLVQKDGLQSTVKFLE